ncbi:DNA-binding NarL/FixJ family response regulator [Variovorax sp. TBS-050B]|uniref:response regulator transcription factor n=1 Tax=Variovorax sp. TBS-050B TaxID=2940551 RepID=UPI0024731C5C|nr:response regulator transcription factor [Variovorax sp. TBS-050B]MDH6593649.1 DNA-binding NarL/FixJ family response regulator [Variovorax sp. TBS-050B]
MPEHLLEEIAVEAVSLSPPLVVEDDPAMRERLGYVLSTLGCDEPQIAWADSAVSARERLDAQPYGIALVDAGLPEAVELIGWMQARHPQVPVVVIADRRTEEAVFAALRAGAIGYLQKENDDLELSITLRSIEQGGAPIDPTIARRILGWLATQPAPAAAAEPAEAPLALSWQERKILELVSQKLSKHDMAEMLAIPKLTVECHTRNIYRKLAVAPQVLVR